ncbi:hypothetical protein [Agathobacter sp.]
MKKRKLSIILIVVIVSLVCVFIGGFYFFTHNKSYKNKAIERGDVIYLNGVPYSTTSELDKYKVTNIKICTTDAGRKLYEIEGYPDYEYIAGYLLWDGNIYKKE